MNLRFAADRRSLLWSMIFFPALPTLVFLKPGLAPWLLPVALYLAYCVGVLTHNHQHAPLFRSRRANAAHSAWLSFFYGCPVFVWLPTHNQNHHRYLNGVGDETQISPDPADDTLWAALSYPTRSAVAQTRGIWRYVAQKRRRPGRQFRQIVLETAAVVLGHGAAVALAVVLYGPVRGALTYGLALGLPAIFASWSMMFTNYVQHVGCDPLSPHNHSRNFVSPIINWLVFQAGYHTVHHEHATAHWSRYPALHAQRAIGIDPSLNERTILGYCLKRYLLRREAGVAKRGAPWHSDAASDAEIAISSSRMRSEAASTSSSTTLPSVIEKTKTTRGTPPGAQTAPGEPSMSAGRAAWARPQKAFATARARSSTASLGAPGLRPVRRRAPAADEEGR